jgi:hypothetical protein
MRQWPMVYRHAAICWPVLALARLVLSGLVWTCGTGANAKEQARNNFRFLGDWAP